MIYNFTANRKAYSRSGVIEPVIQPLKDSKYLLGIVLIETYPVIFKSNFEIRQPLNLRLTMTCSFC